ncbi:hypothetical protein KIF59_08995 [Enterobacter cloacae subsp. cloacae]|nr:hypothetical protein [Enterobacter cloacae subsp. cloacae]
MNPVRGQNNVQGACDGALPDTYPGYQVREVPGNRAKFASVGRGKFAEHTGYRISELRTGRHMVKCGRLTSWAKILSRPTPSSLRCAQKGLRIWSW